LWRRKEEGYGGYWKRRRGIKFSFLSIFLTQFQRRQMNKIVPYTDVLDKVKFNLWLDPEMFWIIDKTNLSKGGKRI
jgi:hypothetical protein